MAGTETAPILVLAGPTAVGKTAVATELAALADVAIVSADSRQIYRGLDIGTAKPSAAERRAAPYYGLDVAAPTERYSAGRFAREAAGWLAAIRGAGRLPLVVGGTGLYLRALFEGLFAEPPLDPERRRRLHVVLRSMRDETLERWARRLDPGHRGGGRQRAARAVEVALLSGRPLSGLQASSPRPAPAERPWYARLTLPRPVLAERIVARVRAMLAAGLVEEVRGLLASGVGADAPALTGVGYAELVAHLEGRLAAAKLEEAIAAATRRYAKRQETWLRHQLRGSVTEFDAGRPPPALARAVLAGYRAELGT